MRHFLQYWKTYNPASELGTPLDFAASAQFKKLNPGDTLWIVALQERNLTLLGRLVVGEVVSRKRAVELLGDRIYDAPLVALAEAGTEHHIIEADIQKLASQLRFESVHDRLDPERAVGQQLQSLRELTSESVRNRRPLSSFIQKSQRPSIVSGRSSYRSIWPSNTFQLTFASSNAECAFSWSAPQ